MENLRLPLGAWVEALLDFIGAVFGWLFDAIALALGAIYEGLDWVLVTPPFWLIIIALAALAYWVKGWKLALGTALGLLLIVLLDQWENAMDTLALVLVAAAIASNDTVSRIVRPILDFLQTIPAFVYLIPAIIFFGVGAVPGMIATILFALAPGVRLTELGIRGVDSEVVEAGQAFGATPGRILRQIQLPLALPSIMAGVNQIIMLSLSMVVIAGMVGAGGLGGEIVRALGRINVGLAFEAGISVVMIAMILDRMTSALADKGGPRAASRRRAKRVDAAPTAHDKQDAAGSVSRIPAR